MEKSQTKKKKFFKRTCCLAVFLFPVIKKGEKSKWFCFFPWGEGKCEIDYKKKRKFFFLFKGNFLTIFGS